MIHSLSASSFRFFYGVPSPRRSETIKSVIVCVLKVEGLKCHYPNKLKFFVKSNGKVEFVDRVGKWNHSFENKLSKCFNRMSQ